MAPPLLWTGGDLPPDPGELAIHIADGQTAGITHVIDNRLEWSDEALRRRVHAELVVAPTHVLGRLVE